MIGVLIRRGKLDVRTDTYGEENTIRGNIHTEGRPAWLSRPRLELHGFKTRNVKDHGNAQKLREKAWPCHTAIP